MDTVVRVACIGFLLIDVFVLFDGVKLIIESNGKKAPRSAYKVIIKKPVVTAALVKGPAFFFMLNHGPDLCTIEEEIQNIPYYKNRSCLTVLGADNDEN
ncbi:MAG: hypothetical protein NC321_16720 [Clostridium sp.]|nr:hypothetical protein [Clostridium sp.]